MNDVYIVDEGKTLTAYIKRGEENQYLTSISRDIAIEKHIVWYKWKAFVAILYFIMLNELTHEQIVEYFSQIQKTESNIINYELKGSV